MNKIFGSENFFWMIVSPSIGNQMNFLETMDSSVKNRFLFNVNTKMKVIYFGSYYIRKVIPFWFSSKTNFKIENIWYYLWAKNIFWNTYGVFDQIISRTWYRGISCSPFRTRKRVLEQFSEWKVEFYLHLFYSYFVFFDYTTDQIMLKIRR